MQFSAVMKQVKSHVSRVQKPVYKNLAQKKVSAVTYQSLSNRPLLPKYEKKNVSITDTSIATDAAPSNSLELLESSELPAAEALAQLRSRIGKGDKIHPEEYLRSKHFVFKEGREERSMDYLKHALGLVLSKTRPIISIDCESYERQHSKVTEIGIAVFDPSTSSSSMIPHIKPIHLIVEEHIHLRNGRYVPDNKDYFSNGTSLVVKEVDAIKILKVLLQKLLVEQDGIFMGHAVSAEVKFFRLLGILLPETINKIDTLDLVRISRNQGSLRSCLRFLDIPHGYLHNAGNDAYYTLLAGLGLTDPVTRIMKNMDVYYEGEKAKKVHHDRSTFLRVDDVDVLISDLL